MIFVYFNKKKDKERDGVCLESRERFLALCIGEWEVIDGRERTVSQYLELSSIFHNFLLFKT